MAADPLLGRTLGDFEIELLIGRGGMGSVYRAEQRKLGRKVALKILSADLAGNEEFRRRFLAESHTAASIDHPNILPVYDAGEADGLLFIAMRLVEGTHIDLRSLLQREGALRPERALALVAQVAAALDAAHARGLVHRDVKPGNILLAGDHVYLTDFGIAKASAGRRELTRTGAFVGTLDYASPEQIRNDAVEGASDIYSLGAVLFHCLTGHVPFDRPSEYGVMKAHLEEPPPLISGVRPELPATLDAVFATAMAKEPDERYRSGRHLMEAARAALAGEAVPGPVPSVRPTVIDRPVVATTLIAASPADPTPGRPVEVSASRMPRAGIAAFTLLLVSVGATALVAGAVRLPIAPPATTSAVPTASVRETPTFAPTSTATPRPPGTATPGPTPGASQTVPPASPSPPPTPNVVTPSLSVGTPRYAPLAPMNVSAGSPNLKAAALPPTSRSLQDPIVRQLQPYSLVLTAGPVFRTETATTTTHKGTFSGQGAFGPTQPTVLLITVAISDQPPTLTSSCLGISSQPAVKAITEVSRGPGVVNNPVAAADAYLLCRMDLVNQGIPGKQFVHYFVDRNVAVQVDLLVDPTMSDTDAMLMLTVAVWAQLDRIQPPGPLIITIDGATLDSRTDLGVPGVEVAIVPASQPSGAEPNAGVIVALCTDDDGRYRVRIPAGRYQFRYFPPAGYVAGSDIQEVSLSNSRLTGPLTATPRPGNAAATACSRT